MKNQLVIGLVIVIIISITYLLYSYYLVEGLTINSTDPNLNQANIDKLLNVLPKIADKIATEIPKTIPAIVNSIKSINTININPNPSGSPDTTLQTLKVTLNGRAIQTNNVMGILTNILNSSIKNIHSVDILM